MHPELARFVRQLVRVAAVCGLVIATFVFVTLPWSLGRPPGTVAATGIARHMT